MRQIATLIIENKKRQFLMYLRDNKSEIPFPNHWDLFGGHIEEGETPEEALKREVKEELGIDLLNFHFFKKFVCLEGDAYPNIKHVFVAKLETPIEKLTLREGQRLNFFTKEEIQTLPIANILKGILNDYIHLSFRHSVVPSSFLILLKDNKFLLSRRYNTGYMDGYYSLIAGHVDQSETFSQAIIREAKEEVGIDIDNEGLAFVHVLHRKSWTNERIDIFFQAKSWKGEPNNMETDKCDALEWFPLNTLPENILPEIKQALNCIQKGVFYSEFGW